MIDDSGAACRASGCAMIWRGDCSFGARDMVQSLTITRPTDWHLHLRDGAGMADVVGHSVRVFARAVVMPNLAPPIVTSGQAVAYRDRILAALPPGSDFEPLMTLFLTDATPPAEIRAAKASGVVVAAKLYPAGATTHSDRGVAEVGRIAHVLAEMEACGLPLLVHGEVVDPAVDIFDRERVFIERVLAPLRGPLAGPQGGPRALQHAGGRAVRRRGVAAGGGDGDAPAPPARASMTCSPAACALTTTACRCSKGREHRQAVARAATGDSPKFFLGTDSAPHARSRKECGCGAAGVFSAPAALELYAEAFEAAGALDRLEAFASQRGADFYGLPRSSGTVSLVREPWQVPASCPFGEDVVVPMRAGETVAWRIADGSGVG